jgi:DNA-binding CsgD family transcriptional regulator/catechol 2,3-dioxygenase-like lactoylglutathione lyase family enzyme
LKKVCETFVSVETVGDLQRALDFAADALGFPYHAATAVHPDEKSGKPIHQFFSVAERLPRGYEEIYEDPIRSKSDPVMQTIKTSPLPHIWGRESYASAGKPSMWEEQADFGMRSGLLIAMHLPGDHHFIYGVDSDKELPCDGSEISRFLMGVQLVAAHAQIALSSIGGHSSLGHAPIQVHSQPPPLSHREIECLKWTAHGKTAWEIGVILSISESTVNKHVKAAIKKWDCCNKVQLVAAAIRSNFI